MFDADNISVRSDVLYLVLLPAVWLQNYFNAIKVNKTEMSYAII